MYLPEIISILGILGGEPGVSTAAPDAAVSAPAVRVADSSGRSAEALVYRLIRTSGGETSEGAADDTGVAPSFDCGAAESSVEQLVCSDEALATLDNRLAARFATALAVAEGLDAGTEEAATSLRTFQRGWISGRDECWKADDLRSCVEGSYLRREGQLVAEWMLEEPTIVIPYTCEDNPSNEVTVFLFDTELPSARIEYGDSVDTATLAPAASGSRYEGSFGRYFWMKGEDAAFVWTEGTEMACTVAG
ncbi:MliC family protein [Oceanibium sediminis]|uniref:MliC family protein n=1 Tax=Oceanibium sediminis TaxID=2026339 RepID=UPI000DD3C6EC|nr:MliC family protein [Oceanibium sediminis]